MWWDRRIKMKKNDIINLLIFVWGSFGMNLTQFIVSYSPTLLCVITVILVYILLVSSDKY